MLAASATALCMGSAWAQDTAAPAAPPAEGQSGSIFNQRGQIEQVTVQSQKRAESEQSVPLPVTALSGVALERKFAVNLEDLNNSVPAVQLSHVGLFHHAAAFTIRGIATSGIESFDDPHVAVFIDNVYQARNAWALSNMLDIEAVEIMRGPQGTLYGRNAYAGAVAVRTNKPDMVDYGGKASLEIANAGKLVVGLVGNVPIVEDKVAFRMASQFYKFGGFWKNSGYDPVTDTIDEDLAGTRHGGDKYVYFRPSLRFTPNDSLDVTFQGEIIRQRGDGTVAINGLFDPRTPSNGNCGGPGTVGTPTAFNCNTSVFEALYPPDGLAKNPFGDGTIGEKGDGSDPYVIGRNLRNDNTDVNSYNFTANASYNVDFGTFNLTTNYAKQSSEIGTDTDGTNVDLFSSVRYEDYKTFQTEFNFVSDFSDTVDVIAGFFYLKDQYQVGQILYTPGIGEFTPDNPGLSFGTNGQDRKTWAAYVQAEYHFTDRLSAVAGVRYSWEKKYNVFGTPITTIAAQGIPAGVDFSEYPTGPNSLRLGPIEDTWDSFAPRVGLNFQATDDILLFAFWQRAFKSGGFVNNAATQNTFESPYGQERIDNYEIGMKSEWFDQALRVNVNAYYQDHTGLQRQIIRPANIPSGQETFTTNAADARAYGVELEVSVIPTDGLTINGNLGYNNIKYTSFCADLDGPETTANPASGRTPCGAVELTPAGFIVDVDYSDLRLNYAPRFTANLGFTYDFPIGNMGNLSFGTNLGYTSKMATQVQNAPRTDRRSMLLVDASLNWEAPNGQYRVSVWGKNLTNEIERLSSTPVSQLFTFEHATRPRTYGVTMTADF
jgi:iron complex outermembrane receptor protein